MTVIAIKKQKTSIEISADSQTTWGHKKLTDIKTNLFQNGNKIFKTNGLVVGAAGNVKEITLFHLFCKTHKPSSSDEAGIIEFMVEFMEWVKKKNDKIIVENHYIIVMKGRVFTSIDGLLVSEVKNYAAVGSGMFLALGALYFGKNTKEAVEVAKELDLYCGGKTQTITIKL